MIFCFQCASLFISYLNFKLVLLQVKDSILFSFPARRLSILVAFTTLSRQYFLSNVLFEFDNVIGIGALALCINYRIT